MKSKLWRFTAGIVSTVTVAIAAPGVAVAGPAGTPAGVKNVGVTHEGRYVSDAFAYIQHAPAANVDSYEVNLRSGEVAQDIQFSERASYGYIGALKIKIDPCASYVASVTPRNAAGAGPTTRIVVPPHLPGGVRSASVKRNNTTTATFTWSPPTARGTHYPEYMTTDTQLFYTLQLVRMKDNTVVQTGSISSNLSKNPMSYKFSNLEPDKTYALNVITSSAWGSCASKTGHILLKAAR